MLKCSKCSQVKTLDEMSKDSSRKGGLSSWCKACRRVSARKWGAITENKAPRIRDISYEQSRNYMLKHRYGITQEDYTTLLRNQQHSCAICKKDINDMTYHLHVDHSHTTGEVRGLLCSPCNVYLGYIKDNPTIFQNGIQYLQGKE
jgi:hypothetical protein